MHEFWLRGDYSILKRWRTSGFEITDCQSKNLNDLIFKRIIISDLTELHEIGLDNLKKARVLVKRRKLNFEEKHDCRILDKRLPF